MKTLSSLTLRSHLSSHVTGELGLEQRGGGLRKDQPLDSELYYGLGLITNAHLPQQFKDQPMRTVAKCKW